MDRHRRTRIVSQFSKFQKWPGMILRQNYRVKLVKSLALRWRFGNVAAKSNEALTEDFPDLRWRRGFGLHRNSRTLTAPSSSESERSESSSSREIGHWEQSIQQPRGLRDVGNRRLYDGDKIRIRVQSVAFVRRWKECGSSLEPIPLISDGWKRFGGNDDVSKATLAFCLGASSFMVLHLLEKGLLFSALVLCEWKLTRKGFFVPPTDAAKYKLNGSSVFVLMY